MDFTSTGVPQDVLGNIAACWTSAIGAQLPTGQSRLGAAPVETISVTSTAARLPERLLQVLGEPLVVEGGVLTRGQADPQVGF